MQSGIKSPTRRHASGAALVLAVLMMGPAEAVGQEPTPPDSLRARVDSLQARVDSLSAALERMQREGETQALEDELDAIRAAAAAAAAGVPEHDPDEDVEFVGRQRSLQSLNPEISINADMLAFSHTQDPDNANFIPREVEISFQSALDPFSRAKIFMSLGQPGGELIPFVGEEAAEEGGELEVDLEEAYIEWVSLPGGFSLKVGQFFQQLGAINRWHGHALPFQARSLPHITFVGEEALSQAGASARVFLPFSSGGTYEATFEVTRSSNDLLYGDSNNPSFLAHVNGFWQLSEDWDLDLGLSATGGPFRLEVEEEDPGGDPSTLTFDQRLYNAEASLTWMPSGRSLYRGLNLRSGVMVRDPSGLDELRTAWGTWVWGELRLSRQWLVGGRYEWVQRPDDPTESAWLAAPTLTWWQSEWVRLRAEYNRMSDPFGTQNQFLIQFTFAMGPHKHETY